MGDIRVFKKELEMEKEKKVKEVKTKKVEVNEKETVKEEVILEKREKRLVKFIALLSSFFATALAILIFVFSVIASISTANLAKEELVNNNIVVTIISKLNNYSTIEVKDLIANMTNRFTFILFEIIIPTIAFVGAMILILVLAKRAIEFVSDITYEKDLYNKRKLLNLQDIVVILSVVLLTTLVIFNRPTIIIYLLIEALLGIVYYLFKKCIIFKKK